MRYPTSEELKMILNTKHELTQKIKIELDYLNAIQPQW